MSQETSAGFHVPPSCPFTIEVIETSGLTNSKSYLIREHDRYGEFPHIYAKICGTPSSATLRSNPDLKHSKVCWAPGAATQNESEGYKVIVLSDTGCGTEVPSSTSSHPSSVGKENGEQNQCNNERAEPEVWNIRTFLEYTINPGGRVPYLVMTTHCHYDHIMGIGKLPPTSTAIDLENIRDLAPRDLVSNDRWSARPPTTVLSSSYGKPFITPYSNLQNHSLCNTLGLQAPRYDVGMWADDKSRVVFTHPTISSSSSSSTASSPPSITTPLTILHTPGHTLDSLSWYDSDLRLLCVGDSFYVKETPSTQNAKWGPEPPMPVIFDLESDLGQWWGSLKKVLDFVRERNAESDKEEGIGDERLRATRKGDDEADADAEDDDDSFVHINAEEVLSASSKTEVEMDSKEKSQTTTMQSPPVEVSGPKRIITAGNQERPPRAQTTQQTGFDIPSPSKRGVIALPILSTTPRGARGRLRADADPDKTDDEDVWMMVVDPVTRPRPQRNPLRLDPVITAQARRVHTTSLPTSSSSSRKKDRNPLPTAQRLSPQPQISVQTHGHGRAIKHAPRVRLCAAHTTLSVDAERAILAIQRFMTRILENDVPCERAEDGPRGEERWIWDDALSSSPTLESAGVRVVRDLERAEPAQQHGLGHGSELDGNVPCTPAAAPAPNTGSDRSKYNYSVLAPLSVIRQGRRSILGLTGPAGVV
ncbi:uncharacterized protein Z520_02312 [Fonsecaea multimorphosa CBS 102226]|uniref:Metallo-beta-lactamase domain-containing protein n=1 Tax=Fonsecaea multimorphosa CBS 102226 TaxID=1442371 RepID=A0A0D2KZF0_9EURO|nr:uncharacterized protein Z520_02312 [Fonsecaea multimorphosa CBS 102226]KIY02174.1 hypothetical protein Z520_02312 [Fonsecaea multimorphosa CBS 102226]OAL29367.1 hypothetical protein AYO22_02261 [Fonsecaea multimorphosa]